MDDWNHKDKFLGTCHTNRCSMCVPRDRAIETNTASVYREKDPYIVTGPLLSCAMHLSRQFCVFKCRRSCVSLVEHSAVEH